MAIQMQTDVLVVAPDGPVDDALASSAASRHWPVIERQTAGRVLREVAVQRPRVVVVQTLPPVDAAVDLIAAIQRRFAATRIIAATVGHDEQVELAARCAGATCYLPDAQDPDRVDAAVRSLLETTAGSARRTTAGSVLARLGALARLNIFMWMLLVLGVLAPAAQATILLQDQQVQHDINHNSDVNHPDGVFFLGRPHNIPGVNNAAPLHDMVQQWYWYRLGNNPEQPINTLTLAGATVSDRNFDGDDDRARLTYTGVGFMFIVTYDVSGSFDGGHKANVTRTVQIFNTGASPLTLSLFEYHDLSLTQANNASEATLYPDVGIIPDAAGNTVDLMDYEIYVPDRDSLPEEGSVINSMSQTTVTPAPSHFEIGRVADASSILDRLNDASATTLSDNHGVMLGPDDLAFAFQWDMNLESGGSYIISSDTLITPEPGVLAVAMTLVLTLRARPRGRL